MMQQLSIFVDEDDDIKDDFQMSLNDKTDIKLGDIFLLGEHRLMCGDSTTDDVEKLMNGNKADMAFTDPPYNVNYTGGIQIKNGIFQKNSRNMIKNDDIDIYEDVFKQLSIYVNGACYIWFAGTKAIIYINMLSFMVTFTL